MTPEDLKKLIERGPTEQMVAALAPLTEADRKKLAKGVVALRKELSRRQTERNKRLRMPPGPCPFCGKLLRSPFSRQCFECGKDWHEPKDESRVSLDHWNPTSETRLKLALFALASWSEAQRIRAWHVAPRYGKGQRDREHLFQVLNDRKPDWLGKWADKELEDPNFGDWDFVRSLVRAQLCPKPQGESYILRMLFGIRNLGVGRSLKDWLIADPDLLHDEIWRIFEVSPARGTIMNIGDITYVPPGNHPSYSWSKALLELAADGKLERQRLLAASLGSLLKNTEARNTAWFAKFHELLEPTAEERLTLQSSYLQLLSHPVPAVVGMALDALSILEKATKLDAVGFVDGVAAVFHLQPKAQPMSAVKILGRITARQKAQASKIAAALLAGLAHPDAQVQQALVEQLGKLNEEANALIVAQLPGMLASLAPSVQEQAGKLVRTPVGQALELDSQAGKPDLFEEALRAPSPWREQAGIDAVLQAFEGAGELTAVAFDPMAVPRLDPTQRVEPIQTLDELIERLTIAVETLDDAIEFELLLDGMSRLCDQRPADFDARVAPLVLRSEAMMHQGTLPTTTGLGLRSPLIRVVRQWCGKDAATAREDRDSILGFLDVRLGILLLRLRENRAAPLLACPTHRPGWIDAQEMLSRLRWHEQHGVEPGQHDFIQGILRLAPDHRAETLTQARELGGKFAAAFRYALGGPLENASLPRAVLAATGRARSPFAELGELHAQGTLAGPDAVEPARYFLDAGKPSAEASTSCPACGKILRTPNARQCFECGADWHDQVRKAEAALPHWLPSDALIRVGVQPNVPVPEQMRDLPTVLMHTWLIPSEIVWSPGAATGVLRWIATVWPAHPDSFFVIGIRLRRTPYMVAGMHRLRAAFLAPLFDPDVPFTEMAQLLVALALNQAEPEVAGLAVDALIELIRDGRCVGPELGGALRLLRKSDFLKLNRLAKNLETASRASLLHAHVCANVVQTACSDLTDIPKDLHHLLGPLLEWLTALSQGVHSDFRPVLARATTGKAGVLAKRLLQLTCPEERGHLFLADALEGRLQRVQRWVSCKG
jgi:hypothetical protein